MCKIYKQEICCQKILPLVYDDSLSYYEVLCKIHERINIIISNAEKMSIDISELGEKFNELKKYVDNYFSSLNLSDEVYNNIVRLLNEGALNFIEYNWLSNKKIVVYGDSSGTYENNFVERLKNTYKLDITNRCIGGTTLSVLEPGINPSYEFNSGYQLIAESSDLNNFDVVMLSYTINDWQTNQKIYSETLNDSHSVSYCAEQIINKIQEKNPNASIVFILPWYCYKKFESSSPINLRGCSLNAYGNAVIECCLRCGANYINLYNTVNEKTYTHLLIDNDGTFVHCNDALSDIVCRQIIQCAGQYSVDVNGANIYNTILNKNYLSLDEFLTTKAPALKISTEGSMPECVNPNKSNTILVKFSGWARETTSKIGFRVYANNKSLQTIGLTNVTKTPTYFEMYKRIPYAEKITPSVIVDSESVIIEDFNFKIENVTEIESVKYPIKVLKGTAPTCYMYSRNGIFTIQNITLSVKEGFEKTYIFNNLLFEVKRRPFTFYFIRNNEFMSGYGFILHKGIYIETKMEVGDLVFIPEFNLPLDGYYSE